MSRYEALIRNLADRLRRREVNRLCYFHTDHFEPWRRLRGAPAVGPESAHAVHDFCRATERADYARRLTLFYKPYIGYVLRRQPGLLRADPNDLVGFRWRTEDQERFGREAMGYVATTTSHDVELHLHHERFTSTTRHVDPEAIRWFAGPHGRSLDESRLALAIRLHREAIARETGTARRRWFFVHGQWALNASDRRACTITNEIDILQRSGCAGDFTFPADFAHTNPHLKVPYFCRAVDKRKGYDLAEAEPEVACGNATAGATKFFIWSSRASARQCSLDYMFEPVRRHLANTEQAARELIDLSYVGDCRLFVKTHAHSMNATYIERDGGRVFPHLYPPTRNLLGVLFEAATRAEITVEFLTAPEVYDVLVSAATKPKIDLVRYYRRPSQRLRTALSRILARAH